MNTRSTSFSSFNLGHVSRKKTRFFSVLYCTPVNPCLHGNCGDHSWVESKHNKPYPRARATNWLSLSPSIYFGFLPFLHFNQLVRMQQVWIQLCVCACVCVLRMYSENMGILHVIQHLHGRYDYR